VLDEAHRRYDEQVKSSSAQLAQLMRIHEALLAHEGFQAKAQIDMANERVQASEAKAQLRLQEQTQRAEMELRQALTETADQDVANTCAAAEMEVYLRKELLEAKRRLAELEPAWETFIAKHNDEEEAQESEQHRRAAVVAAPPSERRTRRLENEANRVEIRVATSMLPSDAAATTTSQLATPRGADNNLSGTRDPGSASTLGMLSPAVSTGLDSAREPGPSAATVDSDAARITEINRGIYHGLMQETHQESTGSSSHWKKLVPLLGHFLVPPPPC
jgi:hypothetical protein